LRVPLDTANGEIGFAQPQVLPGSRHMLLRARRNLDPEDYELVSVDLESGERHVLTKGLMARRVLPGVLVYVRADGVLVASRLDERSMTLQGAPLPLFEGVMIKAFGTSDLTFSASGTLMYVEGTNAAGQMEAVWVSRDGTIESLSPALFVYPAANRGLALSPDGSRLAVDVAGTKSVDIWVKQLPSGSFSRLTFEGTQNTRPSWSPDGKSVVFVSSRGGGRNQLWRQRADGSAPAELLMRGDNIVDGAISPDGQWILYRGLTAQSGRDIWGFRPGRDTASVPLVASRFNEYAAALSPDGRWLAYISDESGRDEVYVRPFPATADGRWQVSSEGGTYPRWAHSGRELFFEGAAGGMMAVPVTTTPTFAAGEAKRLFGGVGSQFIRSAGVPYWDVSPDDRRFLMARVGTSAGSPNQIVVVDNWFEELRARLDAGTR
jgi:serine/threonine-protein kinase